MGSFKDLVGNGFYTAYTVEQGVNFIAFFVLVLLIPILIALIYKDGRVKRLIESVGFLLLGILCFASFFFSFAGFYFLYKSYALAWQADGETTD